MRPIALLVAAAAVALLLPVAQATEAQLRVSSDGTNTLLQIQGDADDDWRFQTSSDLVTWSNAPALGTLLSRQTNAPLRTIVDRSPTPSFYRVVKTAGLYDITVLRTISLTFTQANWSNALVSARTYSTNAYCSLLTMDNGATNVGVGARFRGNTSFTGLGGGGPGGGGSSAPAKKSLAIVIDHSITNADLMNYSSLNLNNAYQDETIMRESVFFTIMRKYTVCPAACLARLYINGAYRGVYSQAQQQNGDLIKEYFPSNDGDRWRAPNMDGSGSLLYLGNTNLASYQPHYELKSDYHTNAWPRLINAIYVFNNTATNLLRDKAENVLAVDRWLWFLALENIFADDDSYWNKGSDYMLYYEPESGRIHPVEHDGNEAFVARDASLSPVQGATDSNRPVIRRLLAIPELRQRYLAHMRIVLQENFNPAVMTPLINQVSALSVAAIAADPLKGYTTMSTYTNDLIALKTFITNRFTFLTNHAELRPLPPIITGIYDPTNAPTAYEVPFITAEVKANGTNGLGSVWLSYRDKSYGRFTTVQMFDDGAHGDGLASDGLFGGATTNYPSGAKVHYYIEARSANSAKAASFAPARAEQETYNYRVALTPATNTPVVINELMASNKKTLADDQGEYDDWIELRNVTDQEVNLTGRYLSDEPNNPRKWAFPAGTKIAASGYRLVWADEDGTAASGLHASFKLSASGEQVFLVDNDANLNVVLDEVTFGPQETDRSYGRPSANSAIFEIMLPTPGQPNE